MAFEPLGWRPLAFSEIEAFPRAVLKHHYPDTPCHGDFTLLKDEPWIVDADMLCGGTPCQSFSVAGNRQSLADDRGNLTFQFVLLADAIDHLRSTAGRDPAWILWENVPGVFSTKDNAFGAFLGGLAGNDQAIEPGPRPESGKSSAFWRWAKNKHVPKWPSAGVVDGPSRCVAWRTLDAQHFGLAQRRKRVFVLARGGAGRWAVADALLPIIEGSGWHPAPSRGTGERPAPTISARTKGGGGLGTDFDCDGGLTVFEPGQLKREGGDSRMSSHTAPTLRANMGDNLPAIAHTLHRAEPPMLVRMREGKEGGGKGPLVSEDQSLCLATANDQVLALAPTLTASNDPSRSPQSSEVTQQIASVYSSTMQVRRLTPLECERLQGFPDGYTNIPWRGKPESPDGNRYKALGNSWAVPCARWIGERIKSLGH